jgi:hypothetical protein
MAAYPLRTLLALSIVAASLSDGTAFSQSTIVTEIRPVSFISKPLLAISKGFGSPSTSNNKKKKNKQPGSNTSPNEFVYTPDTSETTKRLLEWLEDEEVEGLEGVEIGFSIPSTPDETSLRGVFAKQDFARGDYIVAVPFVSTLLVKEDFEVTDTSNDPSERGLASEPENGLLFWNDFLCTESSQYDKYKIYLDCLPMSREDPHFDETPDFWSDKDIQRLIFPSLIQQIQSRKKGIEDLAFQYDKAHPGRTVSLAELQQACWILQTRGFTTFKKAMNVDGREGMLSRVILIPFVDFVNHGVSNQNEPAHASNAVLEVVETKAYDESFYALVAAKTIHKGEEIRICYGTGKETSPELFVKYGFIPTGNEQNDKSLLPDLLDGVIWEDTHITDDIPLVSRRNNDILALESLIKRYTTFSR